MIDFTFRVSWRVIGHDRIASNTFKIVAPSEADARQMITDAIPSVTMIVLEV